MTKQIKSNGRKGFSLVELIVVIAIMAVLVAVLAPSLLSYVERSRAQKDESAMGEVTNAVLLALSDQDVYDELLEHSIKNNVSCYIDETLESKLGLEKIVTKEENHNTAEQYTYGDEARLNDEVAYYAAGNMRGVTITFKPSVGTKSTTYTLATGAINKFKENKGAVMQDCPTLYNTVRATVGDTIEQTSQTYRNSEYTIFIKLGSLGGADTAAQDAVQVYGQYSGTNLPAQASEAVNVATDRATGEGTSASTGNGASANLSGKAPVTMNGEATQTFDKGAPADVVFTSPADFSTFKGVAVNGVMISAGTDYTAESGSTVVTLKSSYMKTLENANYTVMIISDGQYATGTLTVTGEDVAHVGSVEFCGYWGEDDEWVYELVTLTWEQLILREYPEYNNRYGVTEYYITDTTIYDGAFYGPTLSMVELPNSITTIESQAFTGADCLETFVGNGVTYVGDYAFTYCSSLANITLSDNLVTIGNYAFNECFSLTNIAIPNSVASIGDSAFFGCESLTDIYYSGDMAQWNLINFGSNWNDGCNTITVHCTDGDIEI